MKDITKELSLIFNQKEDRVANVIKLLDEGNTVPFIARYRKEMHGSMDDQLIREISEKLTYLRGLEKRKEEIISSIESQEKMTDELRESIENASTMSEVEDLYRPYRPKRKTRASVARAKGLEPLSKLLLEQGKEAPLALASDFISEKNEVLTAEDALAGARDILAEDFSDNAEFRKKIRREIFLTGKLKTLASKEEDSVYSMYYEYEEPVNKVQSHRVLAINRGEKEEFLKVSVICDNERCTKIILDEVIINDSLCAKEVEAAAYDSFDRLIFPSIEREIRNQLTDTANEKSIKAFSVNLKSLLMQPPVKNKIVLGLDPAYRTGCKIAVVDGTGKVLDTAVIYPTPPHNKIKEAEVIIRKLIEFSFQSPPIFDD